MSASSARAAIVAHDVRLSGRLQGLALRSPWLRRGAIPLARSGDGWIWIGGAALVVITGDAGARQRALFFIAVLLATALAVHVGKRVTRRARPTGEWGASYRQVDPHAFPSGHSARAALISVLAFALGPPWLGTILAVWAVLVALSRVALGVHYLSDVIAGAVLGLCCGAIALSV